MDDDGGNGLRNWPFFDQSDLRLHLMSSMGERGIPRPLLSDGGFHHRECIFPETHERMDFLRSDWIHHRENKIVQMLPMNHSYSVQPDTEISCGGHAHLMMQSPTPPPLPNADKVAVVEDQPKKEAKKGGPLKKRSQIQAQSQDHSSKPSKPKKPRKIAASKDENIGRTGPRGRTVRQNLDIFINGIDLDISSIPTPICSCTGTSQQCYRWGAGGWQSACCTTSISVYPLPMSTKRRGARIAGRKMSQGAFKKVLEHLVAEGYDLANPIDLKPYWAKHGTNKFVTISIN